MASGMRRRAREVALQSLYEFDTAHHDAAEVLRRHAEEEALPPKVLAYAEELITGVLAHLEPIDAAIIGAAHEYPIEQMARIDKNILRLAIFEMLYNNAVPAKAAISEAVELAKLYGSDNSRRFVNGVLGTVFQNTQGSPTSNAEK
ncbi:MAG TPA: transcription antitermination factor NusB [Ktedonobacterales bacterium]|nr:transcription antitermination factor NusB [Ktedonobacterales bacterium]